VGHKTKATFKENYPANTVIIHYILCLWFCYWYADS